MSSQAGIVSILTVVLLLIGTAVGLPGSYPTAPDGTVVTPELLHTLILAVVGPLTLLITTILGAIHSLLNRASVQDVNPSNFLELVVTREFWIAGVGALVFIVQVFTDVTIFDENTQAIIADAVLAVLGIFLWGSRPPLGSQRR